MSELTMIRDRFDHGKVIFKKGEKYKISQETTYSGIFYIKIGNNLEMVIEGIDFVRNKDFEVIHISKKDS